VVSRSLIDHCDALMPGKTALWTDGGYVNGGGNVLKGKVIKHHG